MEILLDVPEREAYELVEKGFGEVVFRDGAKKFDRFIKCGVLESDGIDKGQKDELIKNLKNMIQNKDHDLKDVRKALQIADKKAALADRNFKDMAANVDALADGIKNLDKMAALNIGLDLVNIAVDVAGFVIIANKINCLSSEINDISKKIDQVLTLQKTEKYESCQKLLMRFNSFTDSVKHDDNVDMGVLENLIIDMRAFISGMIMNLINGGLMMEDVLPMINLLLPAYTLLVCEHLDRYYFKNEDLPSNYEMFISLYDEMLTQQFIEKLEDYYMFNIRLNHLDMTDAVNTQILMFINEKTQIEDQLTILKELKTKEKVLNYRAAVEEAINRYIEDVLPELSERTGITETVCREVLLKK